MGEFPSKIGRFEIRRRLGSGGMGSLYLAHDPVIDREVAIKTLRADIDNDDVRGRFIREARSAGRLSHINIVTIFEVGDDAGIPYIAMEYVRGETLATMVRSGSLPPLDSRLRIVEEICAGLTYAHRRNVVHRDVKPANVMLDESGTVKILDFGIARLDGIGLTQTGALVGTLNYISPEALGGGAIDHRADIFGVGAVFDELLTSRQAFPGDLRDGVLHRLINEPPTPATTYGARLAGPTPRHSAIAASRRIPPSGTRISRSWRATSPPSGARSILPRRRRRGGHL